MTYQEWLDKIQPNQNKEKIEQMISLLMKQFPDLKLEMKWNQPMLVDHGTYIIGFSAASRHFSIAPEQAAMKHFSAAIAETGYSQTDNLFRIKWTQQINMNLLEQIVRFQIDLKKDCKTFWIS